MNDLESNRNVILLSDHADSCLLLETLLHTRLGCQVTIASDFTMALRFAKAPDARLIIVDLQSPRDEIRFAEMLNRQNVEPLVIFYSNDPPGPYAIKRTGVVMEFVRKPESKVLVN